MPKLANSSDISSLIEVKKDGDNFDNDPLSEEGVSNPANNEQEPIKTIVIQVENNEEQNDCVENSQLQILQNVQLDPGTSLQVLISDLCRHSKLSGKIKNLLLQFHFLTTLLILL